MQVRWKLVTVLAMAFFSDDRARSYAATTTCSADGISQCTTGAALVGSAPCEADCSHSECCVDACTYAGIVVGVGSEVDGPLVCCSNSCDDGCDATFCGGDKNFPDCCPSNIFERGIYCEGTDDRPCISGGGPTPAPMAAPTPHPTTPSAEDSRACSIAGITATNSTDPPYQGAVVCCGEMCGVCSDTECDGNEDCCPSKIFDKGQLCDDTMELPCIIDVGGETSDGDTTGATIALGALLAALVLGNVVCYCTFKFCRKTPTPPPTTIRVRDPNADAELGRLQGDLAAEQNRRIKAEALIQRAKGGGIRPGDFPSVRDVDRDVEKLAEHAIKWTEKACAIGGSKTAMPATIKSILGNTFLVCREEVKRCLDQRLQSLSQFLGNDEPILLSEGDSMNLDTQYVLYECLCRNFRTIVPLEPDHMDELAGKVQQRCGGAADSNLASDLIFGDAWVAFENLMKKYIIVFVEMTLQKPAMDFKDDLGENKVFDPIVHRDWAQHMKAPVGQQCCIIFPAILRQEGRPESNAKTGVVRLPA